MKNLNLNTLTTGYGETARPLSIFLRDEDTIAIVATDYLPGDRALWGYVTDDGDYIAMGLIDRASSDNHVLILGPAPGSQMVSQVERDHHRIGAA